MWQSCRGSPEEHLRTRVLLHLPAAIRSTLVAARTVVGRAAQVAQALGRRRPVPRRRGSANQWLLTPTTLRLPLAAVVSWRPRVGTERWAGACGRHFTGVVFFAGAVVVARGPGACEPVVPYLVYRKRLHRHRLGGHGLACGGCCRCRVLGELGPSVLRDHFAGLLGDCTHGKTRGLCDRGISPKSSRCGRSGRGPCGRPPRLPGSSKKRPVLRLLRP